MEVVHLKDGYIKLGQALKAANLVESGADAKAVGLNPIIRSLPCFSMSISSFMLPKAESIFSSMPSSEILMTMGLRSPSLVSRVALSIQFRSSFLFTLTFVS